MQFSKRDSVFEELKGYCHLSNDGDFLEICCWANGEGYDISVQRGSFNQLFSLTHGEFQLLNVLININKDGEK